MKASCENPCKPRNNFGDGFFCFCRFSYRGRTDLTPVYQCYNALSGKQQVGGFEDVMHVSADGFSACFRRAVRERRPLAKSGCGLRSRAARRITIACQRNEAGNRCFFVSLSGKRAAFGACSTGRRPEYQNEKVPARVPANTVLEELNRVKSGSERVKLDSGHKSFMFKGSALK